MLCWISLVQTLGSLISNILTMRSLLRMELFSVEVLMAAMLLCKCCPPKVIYLYIFALQNIWSYHMIMYWWAEHIYGNDVIKCFITDLSLNTDCECTSHLFHCSKSNFIGSNINCWVLSVISCADYKVQTLIIFIIFTQ